ncbi:2-octaprenyl-3-methyl-6-methoxy-1,4-benzoquinol hydroxylase [Salinivibrio sp. YCSC6]|uniref:2-octaprenyl-3-methyl-6-methoxy-1,4-benzoquinol hydroxylase n=1 Tax=Salinivibrio sp. YCSC6 TaxID=2003370 RepID=UPI000BBBEFA9|nr:2-octaprenyl-3-methyl-6-methoxy-1,4-benzoquinol hydroxylase [Salinivibrio sp. YCSC6]PCE69178.1 2-octaprenyl-3-methyl-6-methoxy-1,4-benzoquinol hydroxylase [Salinivibrio sp. YCSC6]QCF36391.1 2-octaprenyl-3-methyl-6-methoxy-1,4-benzoquinol hydroxylase [Salinivibrio sp. YCSC6]
MNPFEIIIVGGGMVGAATALGLARQGRQVALIERQVPQSFSPSQPMDLRVSAISHASVALLSELGAWTDIEAMRVCPYRRLETWEAEDSRVCFSAEQLDLPQLGYMVENRLIQLGLWQQFSRYDNLHVFSPASITSMHQKGQQHYVELDNGDTLTAPWLIGADGANSRVRDYAKIGITSWDYRQHCMLINVETASPQQDITWQQFFPSGPRSFLPLCGQQASLVWYDSPQRIQQLCQLDAAQLKAEIVANFPAEVGEVTPVNWGAFPLTRRHAQQYHRHGVVVIGDAAHTINPLAGQGVNLGFKDVAALLDACADAGEHWQDDATLAAYEKARRTDNMMMQTGMDVFYAAFSNRITPLKLARNAVFKLAEHSGPVKKHVLKYALGL